MSLHQNVRLLLIVITVSRAIDKSSIDQLIDTKKYFKFACVTQTGYDINTGRNETCLEVAATEAVDSKILEKGARLLYFVVRFMPEELFLSIVLNVTIGIFSSDEFPSSFPEYLPDENHTDCFYSCPEFCSAFCDQGQPIGIRWSFPGRRIVVAAGNIICGQHGHFDPEFGSKNLLVENFAEAIVKYAMTKEWINKLKLAFGASTKLGIWKLSPSNYINYFRQGTVTWFRSTSKADIAYGNMNICPDGNICTTELSYRENIYHKDRQLYDILNTTYSYYGSGQEHKVSVCTW